MVAYEQALQELSQAPLARFVTERDRLAAELRARGEGVAAAQIAKRRRPTTSVWTVNQLYWQSREAFDAMLAVAARLRRGDVSATRTYHDAIAKLRERAVTILTEGGYGASGATVRRVSITLAAIAAAGGFHPDPPGALATDRDPPGFEAVDVSAEAFAREPAVAPTPDSSTSARSRRDGHAGEHTQASAAARLAAVREQRREAARSAAEERRRERERTRLRDERRRVEKALRAATTEVGTRERALAALEKRREAAVKAVGDAREAMQELERKLANLADVD